MRAHRILVLSLLAGGCSMVGQPGDGDAPGPQGGAGGDDGDGHGAGGDDDGAGNPDVTVGADLPVPPVATPTRTDATTDYYDLTMRAGSVQLADGAATAIWGFEGIWPGPTIVATRGRAVRVTQHNELPEPMTIHNHGHKVDATSDGHPIDTIAPGAAKEYAYPNDQRAGTYWYHDHTMDLTGKHVYMGLAGFYIIRDPAEDALGLPSGDHELPLVMQDRTIAGEDNALAYASDGDSFWRGFLGENLFVNGRAAPSVKVATARYRLRLLNGSNARRYEVALDSGAPMTLIGTDGGLRAAPLQVDSLSIAPGERYDVVVDFGGLPVGTELALVNVAGDERDDDDGDGDDAEEEDAIGLGLGTVITFTVDREEVDTSQVPSQLATLPAVDAGAATVTRKVTLDTRDGEWVMNGVAYDANRIDVVTRVGQTEIWEIENDSGQMHPFHLHLVQFQVIDEDGGPVAPHHQGLKDTIPVEPGETVRLLVTWEGGTGVYVYHCHKLEHEDHRMMLQMRVDP